MPPDRLAPCYNSIKKRYYERKLKEELKKRLGIKEYERLYCATVGEFVATRPLQFAEIDHHQLDVLVVDEETRKINLGRPWLTLVIDVYSRAILGIYLCLDRPSSVSVMLALQNTIWPKDIICSKHGINPSDWLVYGTPETICTDNGKEFHSKHLEACCIHNNIQMQYRPTYTARNGGKVERFFRTLIYMVVGRLQGKTFSNPQERGQYDSVKEAVYTLNEVERFVCKGIINYMHKPHRKLKISPFKKWSEGFSLSVIRIPDSIDELRRGIL